MPVDKEAQARSKRRHHLRNIEIKSAKSKQWFIDRPDYKKGQHLKSRYGITLEDYDKMFLEQSGKCKICLTEDPGSRNGRFNVDHNHKTGKVRGLLCRACNVGLGNFKDNVQLLYAAVRYLDSFINEL